MAEALTDSYLLVLFCVIVTRYRYLVFTYLEFISGRSLPVSYPAIHIRTVPWSNVSASTNTVPVGADLTP